MENRCSEGNGHELACARIAAHFSPRWLHSYVRHKLRTDPIYPAAYELLHRSNEPILDIGCGVGLLAFYLRERGCRQTVVGLDVDVRKLQCARNIATGHYQNIIFHEHDVQESISDFSGNIALFDMLHYLPPAEQRSLLARLAKWVAPDGVLIIRDCPRDKTFRFWMTALAEKFAQAVSWNLNTALHFPSRSEINGPFGEEEFAREIRPLWGATPFNNHLFIFRRRVRAVVRDAE